LHSFEHLSQMINKNIYKSWLFLLPSSHSSKGLLNNPSPQICIQEP